MYPHLEMLFYIVVGAKAINFSLNQPSLKQLYIPTTEAAKYKSQAWIETFGSRSSKALASFLNISKGIIGAHPYILLFGLVSTGAVVSWLFIAAYLAGVYTDAVHKKQVVC
jgi:AAA family ATP:ADP antiporter